MGMRSFENATSLERYLNRSVLFIQGIEANTPKSEVLQVLSQVLKMPQQGRIDILTTPDGKMRGTAFCNFHNSEDAKAALEKWRFSLELRGRPLRMQYSSNKEFKEIMQGPLMSRFKILVRNLPEELMPEALFDMFSQYGEILQLHTSCDHHGQYFAIINFVELAAAQSAIRNAHRERVLNHVLLVESYKPNATYGPLPRNINQPAPPPQAATGGGSASGGGAASATGYSGGGVLPGTTYAALQQQQEREMAAAERQAAAADQRRQSESSGAPPPPAAAAALSNGGTPAEAAGTSMAVASFYTTAAAPAHSPTAPGSLGHLLSTALHHVHALDELVCCPITQETMIDPVVAADGNTYERLAIEAWLQEHDTSPMTNEILPHKALTPNNLLRKIVEQLKGLSHPDAAVDSGGGAAAPPAAVADPPAAAADAEPVPVPVPVPIQQQQYQPQQQQNHATANSHGHHTAAAPPPPPPPQSQQQQQQPQHYHHPAPHPQQQNPQHHQQQHHHHYPQQQYGEYGVHHPAQAMRGAQLMAATPVTFVHTLQPQHPQQAFQVQGTTYYTSYRPMGM